MRNRVPAKREKRGVALEFAPVPRKIRHDGWPFDRLRTNGPRAAPCVHLGAGQHGGSRFSSTDQQVGGGSVTRAAAMVNMAQANCYTRRRAGGGGPLRGVRAKPTHENVRHGVSFISFPSMFE